MECARQEQPNKKKVEFVGLESNKVELDAIRQERKKKKVAIRQERKKKKVELEAIRQERKKMEDQNQRRAFLQAALVGGDGTAEARRAARSIRDLRQSRFFLEVYGHGGCCGFFIDKQRPLQHALDNFDTWQSNESLCDQLAAWKNAARTAGIYNEVAEEPVEDEEPEAGEVEEIQYSSIATVTSSSPSRGQDSLLYSSTPSSGQASSQTVHLSEGLEGHLERIVSFLNADTISELTGGGQVDLAAARFAFEALEEVQTAPATDVQETVKAVLTFIDDNSMSIDDRARTITNAIQSGTAFSSDDSAGVGSDGTALLGNEDD